MWGYRSRASGVTDRFGASCSLEHLLVVGRVRSVDREDEAGELLAVLLKRLVHDHGLALNQEINDSVSCKFGCSVGYFILDQTAVLFTRKFLGRYEREETQRRKNRSLSCSRLSVHCFPVHLAVSFDQVK